MSLRPSRRQARERTASCTRWWPRSSAPLHHLPAATSLSGTTLLALAASERCQLLAGSPPPAGAAPPRLAGHRRDGAAAWRGLTARSPTTPGAAQGLHQGVPAGRARSPTPVLRAGDVGHLHGHFCHGVATITWLASRLSGMPFSFTAHAKDIYQADLNPGRPARDASWTPRASSPPAPAPTPRCCAHAIRGPADVHTIYHGLDTD